MSSAMKRVYTATTHAYGEAIDTPPRHPANPPHSGANWQIHESKYSDEGVRLIWTCEVAERVQPKPPSKFHPKKPAKKKARPRPAPVAARPPEPVAKPEAKPKKAKAPRPRAEPKVASLPEVAGA